MARNSGQPARDLFPGHGTNGKGSKTRTNFANPAWQNNFREIAWPETIEGFVREGRRLRKVYGPTNPSKL